jgi:hypothetical protein
VAAMTVCVRCKSLAVAFARSRCGRLPLAVRCSGQRAYAGQSPGRNTDDGSHSDRQIYFHLNSARPAEIPP